MTYSEKNNFHAVKSNLTSNCNEERRFNAWLVSEFKKNYFCTSQTHRKLDSPCFINLKMLKFDCGYYTFPEVNSSLVIHLSTGTSLYFYFISFILMRINQFGFATLSQTLFFILLSYFSICFASINKLRLDDSFFLN
jgi:hypothetical protein